MAMLTNINDAVDGKFLVTRNIANQAETGTVVHIMSARKDGSGGFSLDYRVTSTGQNYKINFKSLKDFFKWARQDTFIARNYDSFTKAEIQKYIKINNRTVSSFCVPIIAIALVIVWVLAILVIPEGIQVLIGILVSLLAVAVVFIVYKKSKSNITMKMYQKLSTKWGVKF